MNYVRIFLITIALLNTYYAHNAETALLTSTQEPADKAEEKEDSKIEEKTDLQKWNEHLDSLKTNDKYWDAASNNPTPEWQTEAFNLAKKILGQDKSMAEALKIDFINALNAKTTNFNDINKLIKEFEDIINQQAEPAQETKEVTPPAPTVPEVIPPAPEPVSEPEPMAIAQPETAATTQEATSTTSTTATEQAPQDLQKQWSDVLESIKNEEDIRDALDKASEIARGRLLTGYPIEMLEGDVLKALAKRNLSGNVVANVMSTFKTKALQGEQSYYPMFYSMPTQPAQTGAYPTMQLGQEKEQASKERIELEKLQKAYAEKDEQQKKEKQERMIELAAAQKAQEEGNLAKAQVHQLALMQKKLEEDYEAQRKKDLAKIQKAQDDLAENMKQAMAIQKKEAEKGVLSTLSDWWYGTDTQKQTGLSLDDQEKLINELVKETKNPDAAREVYKKMHATLLAFSSPLYWNENKAMPADNWIKQMNQLLYDIVIVYKIMGLKKITTDIGYALLASGKMSQQKINETLKRISQLTEDARAQQKQKKAEEQKQAEQKKENREQVALAYQRAKDEKERAEAEKQRKSMAAITYRDEKKQWHNLLGKVAQNKQATAQDNHAHLHQAVKKSHALLQLAHDIPDKNKALIAQKLKQKFSVALLEQQKNNNGPVNIYQTMDLFNNEINKMAD